MWTRTLESYPHWGYHDVASLRPIYHLGMVKVRIVPSLKLGVRLRSVQPDIPSPWSRGTEQTQNSINVKERLYRIASVLFPNPYRGSNWLHQPAPNIAVCKVHVKGFLSDFLATCR